MSPTCCPSIFALPPLLWLSSSPFRHVNMVERALSEHVKLQAKRRVENAHMQEAIDVYLRKQEKPEGIKKRGA